MPEVAVWLVGWATLLAAAAGVWFVLARRLWRKWQGLVTELDRFDGVVARMDGASPKAERRQVSG